MPKILHRLFSSHHTNNTFSPNPGSIPSLFHSNPPPLLTSPRSTDQRTGLRNTNSAPPSSRAAKATCVWCTWCIWVALRNIIDGSFFFFFEERRAKPGVSQGRLTLLHTLGARGGKPQLHLAPFPFYQKHDVPCSPSSSPSPPPPLQPPLHPTFQTSYRK